MSGIADIAAIGGSISSDSSQWRAGGPSAALRPWSGKSAGPALERADDFAQASGPDRLKDLADNEINDTVTLGEHQSYASGITEEVDA